MITPIGHNHGAVGREGNVMRAIELARCESSNSFTWGTKRTSVDFSVTRRGELPDHVASSVTGVDRTIAAYRNAPEFASSRSKVGVSRKATRRDALDAAIQMSDIEIVDFIDRECRDAPTGSGRIYRGQVRARRTILCNPT